MARRIHDLNAQSAELARKFLREHREHTEHEAILLVEAVMRSPSFQAVTDAGLWGRCNAGNSDRVVYLGPIAPRTNIGDAVDLRTETRNTED